MLVRARRELDRMRCSSSAWAELRYERTTGSDGYDCDRNRPQRAVVLWALQYDRRPEDLSLLRWLVEQEAVCRREAPFQGISAETELAGFLLAEHQRVEDVWRQWEVKRANFDTWCGYGVEHLVAAGVSATVENVRGSDRADRADVLELLLGSAGRPPVADAELAAWFTHQRSRFPADAGSEDLLTWVDRARLVGDRDLARRFLDRWAAGRRRDPTMLSQLRHRLGELGDAGAAARVQRELVGLAASGWDSASAWRSLAEWERRAGDHEAAWQALRACARALAAVPDWQECGLGRSYLEELFRLAGAAEGELAAAVFAEAVQTAPAVARLPLVALEVAVHAAEHVGDHQHVQHLRSARDAEARRIGAELGDRPDRGPA